jgi:hypothetical protein
VNQTVTEDKIKQAIVLMGFPPDTSPDMKLSRLGNKSIRETVEELRVLLTDVAVHVTIPVKPIIKEIDEKIKTAMRRGRKPKYT